MIDIIRLRDRKVTNYAENHILSKIADKKID